MAEQAQVKQVKPEERQPRVRYVELSEVVYLPDAPRLAQYLNKAVIDATSKVGLEHAAVMTLHPLGVLVAYDGYASGKTRKRRQLVPWSNVKNVDLDPDPEWKP